MRILELAHDEDARIRSDFHLLHKLLVGKHEMIDGDLSDNALVRRTLLNATIEAACIVRSECTGSDAGFPDEVEELLIIEILGDHDLAERLRRIHQSLADGMLSVYEDFVLSHIGAKTILSMAKKQYIRGKKGRKSAQSFWDKEYKDAGHLAISSTPSEDLQKFMRHLAREGEKGKVLPFTNVIDIGTGNGRNLIYLAKEYGLSGTGFDISQSAITQAKKLSEGLPLAYEVRSAAGLLPFEDESQSLVLDMMVSHYLNNEERKVLASEIARILKPGGWLFFKTFLLDEDRHAKRLLKDNPGEEEGTYIHPEIGVAEHVFTQKEIEELLAPYFIIHKIQKSHGHLRGKAAKRRSIAVYAEKNY